MVERRAHPDFVGIGFNGFAPSTSPRIRPAARDSSECYSAYSDAKPKERSMSAQSDKAGRAKRRGVGDFVKGGPPIVGLTAYTARSPGFSTRMSIFY